MLEVENPRNPSAKIQFLIKDSTILKDCAFTSPSTVAQFVTGRSTSGYVALKVDGKMSLDKHFEAIGLR